MQYDPGEKSVVVFVTKPPEVSGIGPRRSTGLDFDTDNASTTKFSDDVDLPPALFLAEVIQARTSVAGGYLRAQLSQHERFQDPTQQGTVGEDGRSVDTDSAAKQRDIGKVTFRSADKPF